VIASLEEGVLPAAGAFAIIRWGIWAPSRSAPIPLESDG
jgi:hypothetical protein